MKYSLRLKTARFTLLSALLAFSLTIYQCDKKTDDPAPTPTVVGTWKITGLTSNPGFPISGITITDLYSALALTTPCFLQMTVTFNSSGTITLNIPTGCTLPEAQIESLTGFGRQSKWATTGNKITITASDGKTQTTYDYQIAGTTLTMTGSNGTYTLNIKMEKA